MSDDMVDGDKQGKAIGILEQLVSPTFQKIALPIIGYIMIMFFLIQGPVLFPQQWDRWQTITIIYAMFLLPGLIMAIVGIEAFAIPAWKVFAWFGIALAGGLFLFGALFSGFRYATGLPLGGVLPTVIFQIFVVAYAEENFFRGFMLEVGKGRVGIGILAASIMFSIFHLAAYSTAGGLNFIAFGVAFVFGFAVGFVYIATRQFAGIGIVWGLHAGWNLSLLFGGLGG